MKKRLLGVLLTLVLVMTGTSTAFASNVEPQALGCPQCGTMGNPLVTKNRIFQHYETFPCAHGATGKDRYAVYEVVQVSRCKACGYEISRIETEDHVLVSCPAD